MCNWKSWIAPAVLAVAVLTALSLYFHGPAPHRGPGGFAGVHWLWLTIALFIGVYVGWTRRGAPWLIGGG